jgi:hypothetical protein
VAVAVDSMVVEAVVSTAAAEAVMQVVAVTAAADTGKLLV